MAFTSVPKNSSSGGRAALRNKVRIGRGSAKNRVIPMSMAPDVAAAAGISVGSNVSIMVGSGTDAGLVLASPAATGFKVMGSKSKGTSLRVSLPRRIFRDTPKVAMTVRHEVTPDGLVVHLGRLIAGEQPAESDAQTYEARAA